MAQELQRAGWLNARALVGGWKAWIEADRPVERVVGTGVVVEEGLG